MPAPAEKEKIYLAGPEVFLSDAHEMGRRKREICNRYGFEGVFPMDKRLDLEGLTPRAAGLRISEANEELMRGCDLAIANVRSLSRAGRWSVDPLTPSSTYSPAVQPRVLAYRRSSMIWFSVVWSNVETRA